MSSNLPQDYKEMLLDMVEDIDGNIEFTSTLNSVGRSSEKIVIEYDIKTK
tara:strand:+ start:291 stop:440 length:150 start_codon:yes stop_codon:yes gene_type:complete